jgi:hypothetical protein
MRAPPRRPQRKLRVNIILQICEEVKQRGRK